MDPQTPPPPGNDAGRCPCCSSPPSTSPWRRCVKRKLDLIVDGGATRRDPAAAGDTDIARVEVETEVAALREAVAGHQQSIHDLCTELEEERNAASTAASETMSMILRIQREKAEAQMEARQFKRFAEEKMAHDQRELAALDDLLFRREQALQSLSCEFQAYKHRLLSYGIDPSFAEPQTPDASTFSSPQFDLPTYDYPPLRCSTAPTDLYHDDCAGDLEKDSFMETPRGLEDLQNLEHRIRQLETTTTTPSSLVMEKGVVGQSTSRPGHVRSLSADSYGSGSGLVPQEFKKGDEFPVAFDRASDGGGSDDDASDRVYTIDAVHGVPAVVCEDCTSSPRDPGDRKDAGRVEDREVEETDIKKLYTRLQALEADRESMRHAIITMRTEKAQLGLLREIAQQLCKEVKPDDRVAKKPSTVTSFSIMSMIKWIVSFLSWRRKASPSKYTFGLSNNNAGLLLLLDKSPSMGQWRCLTRLRG